MLAFTLGVSLVAGLLFGLIPMIKSANPNLGNTLKEGGRGSSDGRERHRARNTLVVAQVALALVLLVASGLMIRTFAAMRNIEPGFSNPQEILTFRVAIPTAIAKDPAQAVSLSLSRGSTDPPGKTCIPAAKAIVPARRSR